MLIAICGLKGSGKDTVGNYLVNHYGFIRFHFADALKDMLSIIFGWPRELLEGSTKESREFREKKDSWWSEKLGRDITPRNMLQYMGTDLFRNNFHTDIWKLIIEKKINDNKDKNIVITDCRFKNEIEMVRENGGKIMFVHRNLPNWFIPYKNYKQNAPTHIHISETEWIRTKFDYEIENNTTLDELYHKINNLNVIT